jgi:hypothetical protein
MKTEKLQLRVAIQYAREDFSYCAAAQLRGNIESNPCYPNTILHKHVFRTQSETPFVKLPRFRLMQLVLIGSLRN